MNQLSGESRGGAPRLRVDGDELVEIVHGRRIDGRERALDHVRDPEEGKLLVEESSHGHLVGGVEDARRRSAGLARRARESETGERLLVWRRELENEP